MLKRGLEPPSLATADSKSAAYTIPPLEQMENSGLEPLTFALQRRYSTN